MWRYFAVITLLSGLSLATAGQATLDKDLGSTQRQISCWAEKALMQKAQSELASLSLAEQIMHGLAQSKLDDKCGGEVLTNVFRYQDYISEQSLLEMWLGSIDDPEKVPQWPQDEDFWGSYQLALSAVVNTSNNDFRQRWGKKLLTQLAWFHYRNADSKNPTSPLSKQALLQQVFFKLAAENTNASLQNLFELYQEHKTNLPALSEIASLLPTLDDSYGIRVDYTDINTDGDKPRACVVLNRDIAQAPIQKASDFIELDSDAATVEVSGNRLCLSEVDWDSNIDLTIKPGLLASDGIALMAEIKQLLAVGSRQPMLRFHNQGKVLSAYDSKNIAVDYAKLHSADLRLILVNPRNISKTNWLFNESELRNYRVENLADDDGELLVDATIQFAEASTPLNNDTDTVNIDLAELNSDLQPGVYLLALRANLVDTETGKEYNADYWVAQPVVISDIGMASIRTPQNLLVELRDLQSFVVKADAEVQLIAKNNEVLASQKTAADGTVRFDYALISGTGGKRPAFVFYHDPVANHFAYIDLAKADYDLSAYGLDGKYSTSVFETWNWTDRGIYRPGDHLKMLSLIRNRGGELQDNLPLWLKLYRADGKLVVSKKLTSDASGAYLFDYDFAEMARLGDWRIELSLGEDGELLASTSVLVDAIIPSQLEVSINVTDEVVKFNSFVNATVEGKWLYGANASQIDGEGYWRLRPRSQRFSQFTDWQVGLYQEDFYPEQTVLNYVTDANGVAELEFALQQVQVTQPLELQIFAGLRELSGEQTTAQTAVNVERSLPYAALKIDKNEASIAVFDESQTLQKAKLKWTIKQVYYDGYWVRRDSGYWDYQSSETFRTHASGVIDSNAEIVKLPLPTDSVEWRLEVYAEDNPLIAASAPFYNGYYGGRQDLQQKPDQLTLTTDKENYNIGDTVNLSIESKFDGPLTLYLANDDEIVETLHAESKNGKASVSFPFAEDWLQGLWVLANGFDKSDAAISKGVNKRAIGLGWIGLNKEALAVELAVTAPTSIRPDSTLDVGVAVINKDALSAGDTWVSVLAVDEGVYKMAAASYHNPLDFFVGKERFDLSYLDSYGDIIKQIQARRGVIRSGAGDGEDGIGVQNVPEIDIDIVSLWSLPTKLDSDGKANVRLSVPSYNGKLRLITVAWNAERTGGDERFVEVKAPVVSQLSAPYFLSTGDSASMQLRLQNTTEAPLEVNYRLAAKGQVDLSSPQSLIEKVSLAAGAELYLPATIKALDAGKATLMIEVNTADFSFADERDLTIREANLSVSDSTVVYLKPGESMDASVLPEWMDNAKSVAFVADTLGGFDPKSIANSLARYPYGCVEQTTSRVWPYLFADELDKRWGIQSPNNAAEVVSKALIRLDNMQSSSGAFSLWGGAGYDVWLTSYVIDFYNSVEKVGQFSLNTLTQKSALAWLRREVNNYSFKSKVNNIQGIAYAYYILAQAGEASPAEVRLLLNELKKLDKVNTLSMVHLSAALVYLGDVEAAQSGFAEIDAVVRNGEMYDYGSVLRDTAQSIVVLEKIRSQFKVDVSAALTNLRSELSESLFNQSYYQTQEMLWLLQLATTLPKQKDNIALTINGQNYQDAGSVEQSEVYKTPLTVTNSGNSDIYVKTTVNGYFAADKTFASRMNADVSYFDQQGQPVDLANLKVNDVVMAVVKFGFMNRDHGKMDLILAGLIPAGMSLEDGGISLTEGSPLTKYLQKTNSIYPDYKENRDDRHIAAFTLYPQRGNIYYHSFMLRAVRAGQWFAPGIAIEDMYDPSTRVQLPNMKVNIHD